jgi:hypothetical protein
MAARQHVEPDEHVVDVDDLPVGHLDLLVVLQQLPLAAFVGARVEVLPARLRTDHAVERQALLMGHLAEQRDPLRQGEVEVLGFPGRELGPEGGPRSDRDDPRCVQPADRACGKVADGRLERHPIPGHALYLLLVVDLHVDRLALELAEHARGLARELADAVVRLGRAAAERLARLARVARDREPVVVVVGVLLEPHGPLAEHRRSPLLHVVPEKVGRQVRLVRREAGRTRDDEA